MNKYAIYHEPDSNYCYPYSKRGVTLRLRTALEDKFTSISVKYGEKYTFHLTQKIISMNLKYEDDLFSYYEVNIELDDVRFVYVFIIEEDGQKHYYSEDGVTLDYDFKKAYYNCFQLPYINEIDVPKMVPWMKNAVFYEIFIDRFYSNDFDKDRSYINMNWEDEPTSKSFAGGDLKGIISKLEYLSELGINTLYLTPIFSSISNHKYDINNYFKVDEQFGNQTIFKELICKAHGMGIRIVLDAVFNHTSDLIYEFQDVKNKGKKSKYFHWFIIHGDSVDTQKVNYETFSNCYYHPKLNTSNPEVQRYLIEIGKYYVENFDIDGWRLDVADELSHDFWRKFRQEIKTLKSDCLLIGENWHNSYPFLKGDQFDSIMNYSFTKAIIDYVAYDKIDALGVSNKLNAILMRNNEIVNSMMLNLLDSHDTDRFYTEVKKDKNKLLCALAIQFMFKGVPGLYYGIEIPTEGGYDPSNRKCMRWDRLNLNDPYFKTLKQLISLRKNPILCEGEIRIYESDGMLLIDRYIKDTTSMIRLIVNMSKKPKQCSYEHECVSNNLNNNVLSSDGFLIEKVIV